MVAAEHIERIVAEVLRRLREADGADGKRSVHGDPVLRLANSVISLTTIEGKLDKVKQLIVPPKAVVTPSVRDELKRHNIKLVREIPVRTAQTTRQILLANLTNRDMARTIRQLNRDVVTLHRQELKSTVAEMARQLASDSVGIVISDAPEQAVWLANRHDNVRAFVGHDEQSVLRAARWNANLLSMNGQQSNVKLLKLFLD